MNTETTTQTTMSDETTIPPKTKRTRKPVTPPAPRVIDPEIKKLREVHALAVAQLQARRRSEKTMTRMLTHDIGDLTKEDRQRFFDELNELITPKLP